MKVFKTIKYEEVKNKKIFRIEPSRRGMRKPTDPEQMRIFAKRQKRLPELWRNMGIVSWKVVNQEQNSKAAEQTKLAGTRGCSIDEFQDSMRQAIEKGSKTRDSNGLLYKETRS